MPITDQQRLDLEASLLPQANTIPQELQDAYTDAVTTDTNMQMLENARANMLDSQAAKIGTPESDIKRAEIESYLKSAGAGKGKSTAQQTGYVVKGTNIPVTYEDGKYWHTNPETGGREVAKNVEKIGARKAKGTGKGKPKLKPVSEKSASRAAAYEHAYGELQDIKDLKKKVDTGVFRNIWNKGVGSLVSADLIPEDDLRLGQKLASIRNKILKEFAGSAVSEAEGKRLIEEIPSFTDDDKDFDVKMEEFEAQLKSSREKFLGALGAAKRDVSEFKPLEEDTKKSAPMTRRQQFNKMKQLKAAEKANK